MCTPDHTYRDLEFVRFEDLKDGEYCIALWERSDDPPMKEDIATSRPLVQRRGDTIHNLVSDKTLPISSAVAKVPVMRVKMEKDESRTSEA